MNEGRLQSPRVQSVGRLLETLKRHFPGGKAGRVESSSRLCPTLAPASLPSFHSVLHPGWQHVVLESPDYSRKVQRFRDLFIT